MMSAMHGDAEMSLDAVRIQFEGFFEIALGTPAVVQEILGHSAEPVGLAKGFFEIYGPIEIGQGSGAIATDQFDYATVVVRVGVVRVGLHGLVEVRYSALKVAGLKLGHSSANQSVRIMWSCAIT